MGLLGGIAYVLVWTKSYAELKSFENARRTMLGGIAGFVYFFLYSDYAFPNLIMSLVSGYFAADFIESFMLRKRGQLV